MNNSKTVKVRNPVAKVLLDRCGIFKCRTVQREGAKPRKAKNERTARRNGDWW